MGTPLIDFSNRWWPAGFAADPSAIGEGVGSAFQALEAGGKVPLRTVIQRQLILRRSAWPPERACRRVVAAQVYQSTRTR